VTPFVRRLHLAALAFAAFVALPAAAVDLTGSYTGKLTCKGLDAEGAPAKQTTEDAVLQIAQTDDRIVASLDGNPFDVPRLLQLRVQRHGAAARAPAATAGSAATGAISTPTSRKTSWTAAT